MAAAAVPPGCLPRRLRGQRRGAGAWYVRRYDCRVVCRMRPKCLRRLSAVPKLMESLTAPLQVGAQGVATASVLLTDPTSPVYSRRSPRTLADLLDAAIMQLDPAQPLMHAA